MSVAHFSLLILLAPAAAAQLDDADCGLKGDALPADHALLHSNFSVAGRHEYRWQALLQLNSSSWCAAAILGPRWAITAAHCTVNRTDGNVLPASLFRLVAGAYNLANASESGRRVRRVSALRPHPAYNPLIGNSFDVALLQLDLPLPLGEAAAQLGSICLPEETEDLDSLAGQTCMVTGWDTTDPHDLDADDNLLHRIDQRILRQAECIRQYAPLNEPIERHMICSGSPGRSSCGLFSGSPLACYGQRHYRWTLVGVTSGLFTANCDRPRLPDVNMRVTAFLKWIAETAI